MKTIVQIILIISGLFSLSVSKATSFYVDPINGKVDAVTGKMIGDGSVTNPWHTLEEVINANLIETKNRDGAVINQGAPIKAKDRIILKSGYHGFIQIKNAFNDAFITVIAGLKQKPTISGLEIMSAKNWHFSKLTISPAFSNSEMTSNAIVTIGENNFLGNCSHINITDSHIYSFDDMQVVSGSDWLMKLTDAKEGIIMGRHARNLQTVNNYINNVSFGIQIRSPDSKIRGNIITDFSKDGIRALSNNIAIDDNVIKNNYVIDENHPDGIQGFSLNQKTTLANITMTGNIILNRDKKENIYSSFLPDYPLYSGTMQGIGFFNEPINNIQAKDNIIMSFNWQGLAFYGSTNGQIINNTVFTPAEITNSTTRYAEITLKSKNIDGNINNIMIDNVAHGYKVNHSTGLIKSGNKKIAAGSGKSLFMANLKMKIDEINNKYGVLHPVSNQPRIDEDFLLSGVSSIF
jgi:hypothetical protein